MCASSLVQDRLADPGTVGLVDDEQVGDLEKPGFGCLHLVAPAGVDHGHDRVGQVADVDLDLPGPDRLDNDPGEAGRFEDPHGAVRGERQPAVLAPGRHRTDVHTGIEHVALHTDAVA
jgi:hypothetical protein